MSLRKDLDAILREARRQGWRVEKRRSGHYALFAPDGEHVVIAPGTPGHPRSLRHLVALLRRYGFRWEGH